VSFEMGAFPPPLPEGKKTLHICDHVDIGLGMNAATKHPEEVKIFLEWMCTREFADLYANALAGFFTLSDYPVILKDDLAKTFLGWRTDAAGTTIRLEYQILSRGNPSAMTQLEQFSSEVMGGRMTPEAAARQIQAGLESWYKPQQKK